MTKSMSRLVTAVVLFSAGFALRTAMDRNVAYAQSANRVFELRTYTASPGKLEAVKACFGDPVVSQFATHGLALVGLWTVADAPNSDDTLVYVVAHPSREAAKRNWMPGTTALSAPRSGLQVVGA